MGRYTTESERFLVWRLRKVLKMSVTKTELITGVKQRTQRYILRHIQTQRAKRGRKRHVTLEHYMYLTRLLNKDPSLTVTEMTNRLSNRFGLFVSFETVRKTLHEYSTTYKVISPIYERYQPDKEVEFWSTLAALNVDLIQIVWVR